MVVITNYTNHLLLEVTKIPIKNNNNSGRGLNLTKNLDDHTFCI
jgi:hypothetical protein